MYRAWLVSYRPSPGGGDTDRCDRNPRPTPVL